jgi:hypothetical protein
MVLQQNPFYILQATPRDNRNRLAELAEEASFSIDPDVCQKARAELTNPRKRLVAEIAWFPGISPVKAKELLAQVDSDIMVLRDLKITNGLVRFNLLTAGLSSHKETRRATLAQWIFDIARSFEDIDINNLCKAINEDRLASGFPEVKDCSWVENELNERRNSGKKIIKNALEQLTHEERLAALTFIIESGTEEGNKHAPVLIHDLIDDYELESKAELEKGETSIKELVESIKKYASDGGSEDRLSVMTDGLLVKLETWDKAAQPIQVSKRSLGLDHDTSHRVALMLRGLAIYLYNEHSMLKLAQRITESLRRLFSELLDVAELTEMDAQTLKNLEQNQTRERLYAGLEKISRVPSLRTINGFGFMLYGSSHPDQVNGSYLTTYYFTAFFIPIFPICRYRVVRNGNSYSFLGKAPLRNFDKWHLGIVLAIISFFAINAIFSNTQSVSNYEAPAPEAPAPEAPAPEAPAPEAPAPEAPAPEAPAPEAPAPEAPAPETPSSPYPNNPSIQQNIYRMPVDTGLKNEIEQGKIEIESTESNLMRLKADIKSNKALLENYEASGNYDLYNSLVPVYNAKIDEWKSGYKKYEQLLDEVNAKISRYKAGER